MNKTEDLMDIEEVEGEISTRLLVAAVNVKDRPPTWHIKKTIIVTVGTVLNLS